MERKHKYTVAVIIPCYIKHVIHLRQALQTIKDQTRAPDEVVVSVSSASKDKDNTLHKKCVTLREMKWPFKLNIIESNEKKHPGTNRQFACGRTNCDIIIAHDADDLMHPQKVELVARVMEEKGVKAVIHHYQHGGAWPKLQRKKYGYHPKILKKRPIWVQTPFANGHICYRRDVLKKVSWNSKRTAEDGDFVRAVWDAFKSMAYFAERLMMYRSRLSSLRFLPSRPGVRRQNLMRQIHRTVLRNRQAMGRINPSMTRGRRVPVRLRKTAQIRFVGPPAPKKPIVASSRVVAKPTPAVRRVKVRRLNQKRQPRPLGGIIAK